MEDVRNLVETATLAGAVIGSGKPFSRTGESPLKKQYQINKERAVQKFRSAAGASKDAIQLGLPMREAAGLVQQGLMHLALAAFTQVAEQMMRWEVDQIAGAKTRIVMPCDG